MIPILTSTPPKLNRFNSNGSDIGKVYLKQCLDSWVNHGFTPYSVNCSKENMSRTLNQLGYNEIIIERSAQDQYSRPLVYIDDFIKAACNITNGPIVITNADIILNIDEYDLKKIHALTENHAFVSRRVDILNSDNMTGEIFSSGYDFFVFHSKDLAKIKFGSFVMGLPWWDHFLPIVMSESGVVLHKLSEDSVFHLIHSERWNAKAWINIGKNFLNEVEACVRSEDSKYLLEARNSQSPENYAHKFSFFQKIMCELDFTGQKKLIAQLHALSIFNLDWIEGVSN